MSDQNTSLPIRTEANGDVVAKLADGTTPSQLIKIDADGKMHVLPTDGTNSQAYTAASEAKVAITQPIPAGTNSIGTVQAWLHDGAGVSVPLGQAAMAASLPVVIASNQSDIGVKLHDAADNALTSTVINAIRRLDVDLASEGASGSATPFYTMAAGGSDGTNLRTLSTDANGKLKIDLNDATGNAFSTSNPLPVVITTTLPGTEVDDYNTAAAVAAAATSNHDYAITASKTFRGKKFWASASGKLKVEIQTSTNGTVFNTKWVGFNSTSYPNISVDLDLLTISDTGAGSKIRIIRTNLDKQPQDVYSTISGVEE